MMWLSEFLILYKELLRYMGNKKSEWNKRIVHLAKMIDLLYKLVNSGLLIEEHLLHMLEEPTQDVYD